MKDVSSKIKRGFSLETLLELGIQALGFFLANGVNAISPLFAYCFYVLAVLIFRAYVVAAWSCFSHSFVGGCFLLGIGTYCFVMVVLNYTLSILVKPGNLPDLYKSEAYAEKSPYEVHDMVSEREVSGATQRCKKCKDIKLVRAHHCAVCNSCNMKMDHHCVWINNCVGLHNHRYFLLFLTWTFIGSALVATLLLLISKNDQRSDSYSSLAFALSLGTVAMMVFFNCQHWFLALRGQTSIEFWYGSYKSTLGWRQNMFLIFGTTDLVKALLVPSFRRLPFSGLEWSVMSSPEFRLQKESFYSRVDIHV